MPIERMANIILTKDFSVKEDQNGKGAGHSTYYFPDGSIVASVIRGYGDTNRRPCCRQNPDRFRQRRVSGRDRRRLVDGDQGDKSPLKGAALYNIELDVTTPGT
jgi:hypothetical protein